MQCKHFSHWNWLYDFTFKIQSQFSRLSVHGPWWSVIPPEYSPQSMLTYFPAPRLSNSRYDKFQISLQNLVLLCVLIKSSQINSSNFEIWYREGPQKQKILSFLYIGTKNFWIEFQFCRQKLYQIEGLFFQFGVSW